MKPEAGKALGGRYRLVRQIAVGGMGEVWVARDESLAREIAIKVLKQEFVGNDDFLNRFRIEARNSASLSHANIAQLYDYGEQDGSAYLVMELVSGEPMSDLLEREHIIPIARLLSILAQTSRALHAAHVGGVVHRDVKPGNILLEESGDVKITDFGVSVAANQIPMTAAGMVMGTAQYLSPEQAIGQAATGVSDVYALGIVAYEAIAGRRPFTGKTPVDIAIAHVNEAVPPLPASTDPELAALIIKMLAKEPADRPRSAAALAHTFESLIKRLGPQPKRASTPSPVPLPDATRVRPAPTGSPTPEGRPRAAISPAPATRRPASKPSGPASPPATNHSSGPATPAGPPSGSRSTTRRTGPPAPDRTRSGARASSVRPVPSSGGVGKAGVRSLGPRQTGQGQLGRTPPRTPVNAMKASSSPRATAKQTTSGSGLMQQIKELGAFTLALILIIVVILGATIIRSLTSDNDADSAMTQISDALTVQFIAEQFDPFEPGSIEGLVTSNGNQSFPKIKDAKW